MRKFLLLVLFAGFAARADAAADFFGVKMISEDFARDIAFRENITAPDFTNDRPGTDKRIYAYGYSSSILGRGRGVSFIVHNHSEKEISTEYLFRECIIITKDNKRYEASETEMQWRKGKLRPGDKAVFNIRFPGVDVPKGQVRMIILSFGLGETQIFLYPLENKQGLSEARKISSVKPPKKKRGRREEAKTTVKETALVVPQNAEEYGKKETDKMVGKIAHKDRLWSMNNPDRAWQYEEKYTITPDVTPRANAEVVIVNPDYRFVVVNAGKMDGILRGTEINIRRGGRRIARVTARQVRDRVTAASILPEWATGETVKTGDLAELEQKIA